MAKEELCVECHHPKRLHFNTRDRTLADGTVVVVYGKCGICDDCRRYRGN